MTKISGSLLRTEFNQWLKLKKTTNKTISDKLLPFGKHMNKNYNLKDKVLENELDYNTALFHIMVNHVPKENKENKNI
tara:strand:- start:3519 stop:3752 length:234 start_codon:yes stop_codon:yes gene_type:complete